MKPITHGTNAGYQTHNRRKEEACDPCREAAREYNRASRRKVAQSTRAPGAMCGTNSGYYAHLRRQEETCARCRAAHAEYTAVRKVRQRNTVRIPLQLFADLYWTADGQTVDALDEIFGSAEVDALIERADKL